MRRISFLLAAACLAATHGAPAAEPVSAQASSVRDLASLLEGEFTTQAPALNPSAGSSGPTSQPLFDQAKRVDVPAIGSDVVYAELREGSRDGRLLRQVLYGLKADPDSGRITMTTYRPGGNTAGLAGVFADPAPLAKLGTTDLQPQGCPLIWRRTEDGFEGDVSQAGCAPGAQGTSAHMVVTKTGMVLGGKSSQPSNGKPEQPPLVFRRLR